MAQIVKLRRTSQAGKTPTTSNLELGELAMNTNDGRIFFEKNDGSATIQEILTTNPNNPTTGSINLNGSLTASSGIQVSANIMPDTDNTLSLGSSTLRFQLNGGTPVTVDGNGTANTLTRFQSATTVEDSTIFSSDTSTIFTHSNNGNTIFTVSGSNGELLTITDSNTGNLLEVNDASGIDVFTVSAVGDVSASGAITASGIMIIDDISVTGNISGSTFNGTGLVSGSVLRTLDGTDVVSESAQLDGFVSKSANFTTNEIIISDGTNSVVSTDLLTIDPDNNRVGVGTSSPSTKFHIAGDGANEGQIRLQQANDGGDGPDIAFYSSRGTVDSPSSVQNNDTHGRINAYPYNGTSFIQAGSFGWSGTDGTGNNTFDIRSRVSGTLAKRIEITSAGKVKFSDSYEFPTSDGSANQVLQTDGSGVLSFGTISGYTDSDNTDHLNSLGVISGSSQIIDGSGIVSESSQLDGFVSKSADFTTNELLVADGTNSVVSSNILSLDTANNYLGINQSNPEVTLHMTGEGAQTAQIRMEQHNNSGDAPDIRTRRTRGTADSPTAVNAGDFIYRQNHEYYTGTEYRTIGQLAVDVNSTNADRFQLTLAVSEDGTAVDAADNQFKIDGNDGGAITFNGSYKFPTSDGTNGQALVTNGSGVLSFGAPTADLNGTGVISGSVLRPDGDGVVSESLEGDNQGQIKLNNVNVNVNDLGTDDSPTFTNLTLTGNLTVQGTTTTENSQEVNIGDNILNLNYGGSATEGGILVSDGTGASTTSGSLKWDSTNDYWKAGKLGSEQKLIRENGDGIVTQSAQIDAQSATNPAAIYDNSGTPTLRSGITQDELQTAIGVDAAGTKNSTDVTLAGSYDYITAGGTDNQTLTLGQIDLATDVTGILPSANLDADTAHLSGTQTFTGAKTFNASGNSIIVGDTLRIAEDGSGMRMTNVGAFESSSAGFHIFSNDDLRISTNGSGAGTTALTLDKTTKDATFEGNILAGNISGSSFNGTGLFSQSAQVDYNNIQNQPSIPTVNNGALTVQGTGVLGGSGTFTANDSTSPTISITHDAVSRTNNTSTASPSAGGTFTAIDSITTSNEGHITAVNTKTVTLPDGTVPREPGIGLELNGNELDFNGDGTGVFSESIQIDVTETTNYSSINQYTDSDNTSHLNSLDVVSGSDSDVRNFLNVEDGANNYTHPNHSGDVTSTGDGATTIANNVVTHAKYQQVSEDTIIGRTATGTGNVTALTKTQVREIINVEDGATNYGDTNVKTKLNTEDVVSGSASDVKSFLSISSTDISDVDAFSQSGNYSGLRAQATTKADVGLGNVPNSDHTAQGYATGDNFDEDGTFASLRAQGTTKEDVGLGNVENTTLSTYTGQGGALDNQYITNGAGYITSFTNTNQLTTFVVEDGDGTEVTISQDKEWKFVEGTGIDIDWTDTSNGSDGDPYDLTIGLTGDSFDADGTFTSLRAQGTTAEDVGLGNVTNESKATMFDSPTFTGTVSGVSATHVGLGNVTNESKATMFSSPTFTGTVSGVSATHVGLGNVTNESKATMFTNAALTGNPTAPTQTSTNDSTRIATTAFVQTRIDEIIGNAGSTLDTLGELSASLADDQDALTSLTTTVGGKLQKDQNLNDLTDVDTALTNLGLENVTNESKATMFTDPTFTGTVSGVTKSHVGLGNVENTALSTYTGNGGALDNQYITNGAGYITSFTNTMGSGFKIIDGDTTEVTITENKYIKFREGESIDINFTDTSNGSSSDPYDLTFSLKTAGVGAGTYGSTANGTKIDQITVDAYGRVTNITTGATGTSTFDGSYSSLTGTPSIPSALGDLTKNDLQDEFTLSNTNVSEFNNDAGYISSFDITTQTDSKYLRSNATDTASGVITFSNTTDSTSTATGAVKVSGGVGIAKALNIGTSLTVNDSTNGGDGLVFSSDTLTLGNTTDSGANGRIELKEEDNGSTATILNGNNNFLLYRTNLAHALEHDGTEWRFQGNTQSTSKTNGAVVIDGGVGISKTLNVGEDVVAYASSDERYKDNVTPIENPNEKLKQIGGYTFDWNDKHEVFKGQHDVGVIAQEIEKVLPEIVETRESGYKAVKYEKIVALLIESNKELLKRIEDLESKLK